MTPIGTAVLQIIPSLDGVSASIDKQLGGLQASGRKGGKALAKGVGEGLKDLEREVESAGKAYTKLRDKASDALGKVRSDEAALQRLRATGASDDKIIRAEERLATSRRNSSRAVLEAKDSYKSLQTAQGALSDSSDNLGRKMSGLSQFASAAGNALGAAGAIAGGAALVGIAALATGVAAAARELYDLGAQFDDLSDNLQVKTGLSGAALDGLKASVENLGTTSVPDTFANIGDVAADVTRNLHLTGQPLEDVTSRLANLKRLGVDVNVRALGKAFRGFGIDTKDQVPALNGLYEASTKSGLSIDDLLASVVKGGAPLRALGLTFGESAALVTTFEDAGLDADKSIAGLTKGLANFSKDGKQGSDALREAVAQIKALADAGNDAGAIDLSNKLFGAKGGVAFFDAIKNGSLDLQSLSDSLSTTGQDINAVSQNTADWSEKWQDLKNKVSVALEPLATRIFDGVNEQLGTMADSVVKNKDVIIKGLEDVADAAVTMAEFSVKSMGLFSEGLGQLVAPLGDVLGAFSNANAAVQDMLGRHDIADQLRADAQDYFSLGDGLKAFGREAKAIDLSGLHDAIHGIANEAKGGSDNVTTLSGAIGNLAGKSINVPIKVDTSPANVAMQGFFDQWSKAVISPQVLPQNAPGSTSTGGQPNNPLDVIANRRPPGGRATGGPVFGAGTATSDSIPAWLSNGEHVWTAKEVDRAGGHGAMYRMRDAVLRGFSGGGNVFSAGVKRWPIEPLGPYDKTAHGGGMPNHRPGNGGAIGLPDWSTPGQKFGPPPGDWWFKPVNPDDILFPDQVDPGKRQQQKEIWERLHPRIKLLGFSSGGPVGKAEELAASLNGLPYIYGTRDCSKVQSEIYAALTGKPTGPRYFTTESDFAALGFLPGYAPGAYNIGISRGGGGKLSHMAGTLPNGVNFEAGGRDSTVKYGGNAEGANDFPLKFYLPVTGGDPPGAGSSAGSSPFAGGSAIAAATTPATAPSSSGSSGGGSSGGNASISLPSSFSGLAGMGLDGLGIKTKVTPDSPERTFDLGGVAATAIGGQISSALDVFGVGDSPPFLQAASKLISGISVSSKSAAPLSASPTGQGAPVPDGDGNMHGARAGQQPGPVYNITARDTEDAFVKANRVERERAAAKLSRF